MARPPKPWLWKRRQAWFVTIDGTRHFLAADKEAALTRFHQLMAEPQKRVVRSDSLAAIIDLFLDWCQKHRARDTYEWYRYRLERFVQTYPDLRTHELRPFHVQQWLDVTTVRAVPDSARFTPENTWFFRVPNRGTVGEGKRTEVAFPDEVRTNQNAWRHRQWHTNTSESHSSKKTPTS